MGQKINPKGLRLAVFRKWASRWFTEKERAKFIIEDKKLREYVLKRLENAGIAEVEIERAATRVKINICTARPGIVIGKKGKEIDDLRADLKKLVNKEVALNIIEIRKPDLNAKLLGDSIVFQIVKRTPYRRAVKDAITKAMRAGAEGVRVRISGRLNGSEIARSEQIREGSLPLHTLRADIDYALCEAHTTYGVIGIKVWVFKGEKFTSNDPAPVEAMAI